MVIPPGGFDSASGAAAWTKLTDIEAAIAAAPPTVDVPESDAAAVAAVLAHWALCPDSNNVAVRACDLITTACSRGDFITDRRARGALGMHGGVAAVDALVVVLVLALPCRSR